MSCESPAEDGCVRRFWARYEALLTEHRIPAKAIPWYRRRVEDYIAAHPDRRRLRDHGSADLEHWLDELGRNTRVAEKPAFPTRVRREAAEVRVDTRRATDRARRRT